MQNKTYLTNEETNKVFKQTLRALDPKLVDKNRKESKIIICEEKNITYEKHRKNKSTFDSSLSFDIKSDIRPQIKTFNHKNYSSNVFNKPDDDYNHAEKSSIKTFNHIRNKNPEINYLKEKLDFSPIKTDTKSPVREKTSNSFRNIKRENNQGIVSEYTKNTNSNIIKTNNNIRNYNSNNNTKLRNGNNPITHRTTNYSGNLKFVKKESNILYYEESQQAGKDNTRNVSQSRSEANKKIHNSDSVKDTLTYGKSYSNLADKDFNKINNKSFDCIDYKIIDNKKYNIMKFQHFNYEPMRAYYI